MKKNRILIIILIILCLFGCTNKNDDEIKYVETDLYPKIAQHSNLVFTIDENAMNSMEAEMIASLQGIVAKTNASIYIINNLEKHDWLETIQEKNDLTVRNVSNPWELVDLFKNHIKDQKYVLYKSNYEKDALMFDQTINYATTVAGVESYLMISESLEAEAKLHNLSLGKDVRDYNTARVFNEYKDRLNKDVLIHQTPAKWQLRDYSIAVGAMCFYSDFYDGENVKDQILSWANKNIPILGWTENEINFVESNSIHGKITLASDWSANLSFTSSFGENSSFKQKNYVQRDLTKENKHYVAIVMSDGDNLQWMQNGFTSDSKFYGSEYRGNFPMTWTISPAMADLTPSILDYIYENGTTNDQFIAGPSGVGYVNMAGYNSEYLKEYSQITASYMKETDMQYINLLDNSINTNALDELAKYDSVQGGVWSVGDKYIEGAGGVYWSNDKPFVTMRETLWRIPGDDAGNNYYGFVERVAQRINEYKIDPTSIEGYTVVVAHAWSIGSMNYLSRFVELLDDDVELVTVGELLELVKENVPHENKKYLDDIQPSDIKDLAEISSEQYHVAQLNNLQLEEQRSFIFTENTRKYKWQFGNGGLQYDFGGYSTEGIKLDGSDLEDVIDPMPNSWTVNKFKITEDDKILRIYAHTGSDADVNYRVRVIWIENGVLHSEVLSSLDYEKQLSDHGWYKMNGSSPLLYNYDLTKYINKEVFISIEQDDTGDGSGEVVNISRIEIQSSFEDIKEKVQWTKSDLETYWKVSGTTTNHKEGVCLEGENAKIYNNVVINGSQLKIAMRKFQRSHIEEQDITGYAIVKINGEVIRARNAFTDYIQVTNIDEWYYYVYDVSQYVGQEVTLEIISVSIDGVVGEHICVSSVVFQ